MLIALNVCANHDLLSNEGPLADLTESPPNRHNLYQFANWLNR